MFIEISGNAISHNIVVAPATAGELIHMVVVSMTRVQGNLSQPESRLFFVLFIWSGPSTTQRSIDCKQKHTIQPSEQKEKRGSSQCHTMILLFPSVGCNEICIQKETHTRAIVIVLERITIITCFSCIYSMRCDSGCSRQSTPVL